MRTAKAGAWTEMRLYYAAEHFSFFDLVVGVGPLSGVTSWGPGPAGNMSQ